MTNTLPVYTDRGKLTVTLPEADTQALLQQTWEAHQGDQHAAVLNHLLLLPLDKFREVLQQNDAQTLHKMFVRQLPWMLKLNIADSPKQVAHQAGQLQALIERMGSEPGKLLELFNPQAMETLARNLNVPAKGWGGSQIYSGVSEKRLGDYAMGLMTQLMAKCAACPEKVADSMRLRTDKDFNPSYPRPTKLRGALYEILKHAVEKKNTTLFREVMEALPPQQQKALLSAHIWLDEDYNHRPPQAILSGRSADQQTFDDTVNRGEPNVRDCSYVKEEFKRYAYTPESLTAGYLPLQTMIQQIAGRGQGAEVATDAAETPKRVAGRRGNR